MMRGVQISVALGLVLAMGCESRDSGRERERFTVFAASSLSEAFGDLADAFAQTTGAPAPTLVFAGSQVLRLQIEQGARADVFASASVEHMTALAEAGHVAKPEVFAYNELVVIVPKDNPASIRELSDLARARRLVIGAPEVPIGIYTRELFDRAEALLGAELVSSIRSRVVSEESNVRLVRAKVELGEADAAIVYRTDASEAVKTIELPPEISVRASYYIGLVEASPRRELAKGWIAFVESEAGRAVLEKHGFLTP